jgi:predicted acetyltransferase
MPDAVVRTLDQEDLPRWLQAKNTGFLNGPEQPTVEEIAFHRKLIGDLDRAQGAFDPRTGRCVGTFRTFAQEMTMPGGAVLPVAAVTNVTVSPTHRRTGLLRRMTERALAEAKDRGDAFSTLVASEYPIYGRFGYGPASWAAEWEVDVMRTGLDRQLPASSGTVLVDLVDPRELLDVGPEFHERYRRGPDRQGTVDRPDAWWDRHTGRLPSGHRGEQPYLAVARDAEGTVQGLLAYTADKNWEAKLPEGTVRVQTLTAGPPEAERALWEHVLTMDWIVRVRTGLRAPDDLLPELLPNPRAARLCTHADFLWVRPLDVPGMLESRSYAVPGRLVLDLHDPTGLAGGRYRLDVEPDEARCTRTSEEADLSMGIGVFGSLALGDASVVRLSAGGLIHEHTQGAAARADALLRTGRRAWCPDVF